MKELFFGLFACVMVCGTIVICIGFLLVADLLLIEFKKGIIYNFFASMFLKLEGLIFKE